MNRSFKRGELVVFHRNGSIWTGLYDKRMYKIGHATTKNPYVHHIYTHKTNDPSLTEDVFHFGTVVALKDVEFETMDEILSQIHLTLSS